MGHREDLLEGAKRCLLEKGFLRTTARDVVRESGTNLASIGYHYGSKDALLAQAYIALIEETGEAIRPMDRAGSEAPPGSLERFSSVWGGVIRSLGDARAIWALTFELVLQGDRMPEARKLLAERQAEGRAGILPGFLDIPEAELDADTIDTEGRLYQTLLNGLMVQWLFDPPTATSAAQLAEGLRRVAARLAEVDGGTPGGPGGGADGGGTDGGGAAPRGADSADAPA